MPLFIGVCLFRGWLTTKQILYHFFSSSSSVSASSFGAPLLPSFLSPPLTPHPSPLTPRRAVERLGELLKSGELKDIVAIPTSIRTKEQAESLGIPLVTLDTHSGGLNCTMVGLFFWRSGVISFFCFSWFSFFSPPLFFSGTKQALLMAVLGVVGLGVECNTVAAHYSAQAARWTRTAKVSSA